MDTGMSASKRIWQKMLDKHAHIKLGDMVSFKHPAPGQVGRIAIVVERPPELGACKIQWVDEAGLGSPPQTRLLSELVKITE